MLNHLLIYNLIFEKKIIRNPNALSECVIRMRYPNAQPECATRLCNPNFNYESFLDYENFNKNSSCRIFNKKKFFFFLNNENIYFLIQIKEAVLENV